MKIVCSWCNPPRLLGTKPGDDDKITHTACPECADRIRREADEYIQELCSHGAQAEEPAVSDR